MCCMTKKKKNIEEVPVYAWNVPDEVWERINIDLVSPVNGLWKFTGHQSELRLNTFTEQPTHCEVGSVDTEVLTGNSAQFTSTEKHILKRILLDMSK